MRKYSLYIVAAMLSAGVMMWGTPFVSYAEQEGSTVMVEAMETDTAASDDVDLSTDEGTAASSPVLEAPVDEDTDEENGPDLAIQAAAQARAQAEAEAKAAADAAQAAVRTRQGLVDYAMQFLGGPYRSGGNDPHTGADCSGFVKYIMQNGAGITMNRSSVTQATQGRAISASQMQPGDLIFYGNGSHINHVAMYIGNGQIIHASTYKTGIKISNWDYRSPVKIISVLG